MGIQSEDLRDLEDSKDVEDFNKRVILKNNRYQMSWPWKTSKYELPSNYELCVGRLK